MKYFPVALFAALGVAAFAQQPVPEIPFDSAPNFFKLPPDLYFGEVSGVAVNSKGHVFVFSRGNTTGPAYGASAAQLLEFGADGKYIRRSARTSTRGPTRMPCAPTSGACRNSPCTRRSRRR